MNVNSALSLFSFIVLLYWVIAELFTFIFRLTGLPADRARFQVTSLLTGTGFTTRESEAIMASRSRRRLARITMLFGFVFNITIVSAFINVFISMRVQEVGQQFGIFLIPLGILALIFVLMRIPKVHAWAEDRLERLADYFLKRTESFNAVMMVDNIGRETIAQVTLRHIPDQYRDLTLARTGLRAETGILVMLVEHPGEKAVPAQADTVFRTGDKLTVFGDYKTICKSFHAREHFADN